VTPAKGARPYEVANIAGVTGVFTLAMVIRSESYGEGLILKLIFSIKIKNRGSCYALYGALV